MSDCIFCKIANGEIKARLVRETPELVAFLDLNPQAPTHILIVPRRHIASLAKCGQDDEALLGKIQLLAADLAAELGLSSGFRLVTN
ncbi:MAG TPA: HIT domain-containing protein, partial [Elusimicrobiales bacterium]|nr:HIT domain-containing protein [Elusimicrobiales bacterium]